MSIAIVKKEEMAPQYDANGFSRMEMLPGTFPGAHNYKCFLKAGMMCSRKNMQMWWKK